MGSSKLFKRLGIALTGMALAIGVGVGLSQRGEYKEARAAYSTVYTLNCAGASENGSEQTYKVNSTTDMAAVGIAAFINAAAGSTILDSTTPVDGKSGYVYWSKGSGGNGIPNNVLKIGKASDSGSFTMHLASNATAIKRVCITGYGWKNTTAVAVNGSATQSPQTAATEVTFNYVLASATKDITVSVTTSAFCVTEILLQEEVETTDPEVTLSTDSVALTVGGSGSNVVATPNAYLLNPTYSWSRTSGDDCVTLTGDDTNTVTIAPKGSLFASCVITLSANGTGLAEPLTYNVIVLVKRTSSAGEPFTVDEARKAIDANEEVTGATAIGIVSQIVTPYDANNHNITFNISADGLTTGNQLQAYRCVGTQNAPISSDNDVMVGDVVKVSGNLLKYNTTYEFAQDNTLISNTKVKYTVSFNGNGGSGSMADIPNVLRGEYTLPDSDYDAPANTVFAGWKANNLGDIYKDGASYTLTGNTTFYAQWGELKTITSTIINGSYTGDDSIVENGSASITIVADTGYKLPTSVTVTGATSSYNSETGVVSLSNPTSNVTISAACVALANYTITITANNCTYSGDSSIQENGEATIVFSADDGYVLPGEVDSISGATVKSFNNGQLVLQNPTGAVSVSVTAVNYANTTGLVSGGRYYITNSSRTSGICAEPKSASSPLCIDLSTDSTSSQNFNAFDVSLVGDNTFTFSVTVNGVVNYLVYNSISTSGNTENIRVIPSTSFVANLASHAWKLTALTGADEGLFELTMNNYNTSNRFLSLNGTKDWRGQASRNGTYKFRITEEGYFADQISTELMSNSLCDGGSTAPSTDTWTDISEITYIKNELNILKVTEATPIAQDGSASTGTLRQNAMARYDYIMTKYNTKSVTTYADFLGRIEKWDLPIKSSSNPTFSSSNISEGNTTLIAIIIISSASLIAVGGYFFIRRRKER